MDNWLPIDWYCLFFGLGFVLGGSVLCGTVLLVEHFKKPPAPPNADEREKDSWR